ncbi:MAG: hypothetical protein E2P05_08250 [Acidobacteria bacterium]|nr:MAG: hypothetical protein E2P05_08250 [Acidobacteriota bacterium]
MSGASRPYASNDNPYSESQFNTLKYQPEYSERFGRIEDSRHFSGTAPSSMDQQTDFRKKQLWSTTLNSNGRCLNVIDIFRCCMAMCR